MNVEQVLGKLERVQAIGTRGRVWFAKCPTDAHILGGNPTLEVRRLDGGQVWLRCHGGCADNAVYKAVGLKRE